MFSRGRKRKSKGSDLSCLDKVLVVCSTLWIRSLCWTIFISLNIIKEFTCNENHVYEAKICFYDKTIQQDSHAALTSINYFFAVFSNTRTLADIAEPCTKLRLKKDSVKLSQTNTTHGQNVKIRLLKKVISSCLCAGAVPGVPTL